MLCVCDVCVDDGGTSYFDAKFRVRAFVCAKCECWNTCETYENININKSFI